MSGSVIGGVVGAVIGSFIPGVGTQLGYLVGSAIGGYIDPTQVFGPRLTDATQQTAMDGVPRTYGYGTFPTTGNLIWCSELREQRNSDDGKGSPTEQVTYTYYRSYAIAVCEGPADGTGIAGYRLVKRNGKVVFDARTDAELTDLGYSADEIAETRAAQSKFLQKVRFYYGVADQEPDPTIQAVKGAENVPGYSYTAYMVVADDDVTELRGAVPQYDFVVSVCGTRTEQSIGSSFLFVTGQALTTGGPVCAYANEGADSFIGIPTSTGADVAFSVASSYGGVICMAHADGARYTVGDLQEWDASTITTGGSSIHKIVGGPSGWILDRRNSADQPASGWTASGVPSSFTSASYPSLVPGRTDVARYLGGYYYRSGTQSLYRSASNLDGYEFVSDGSEFEGQLSAFKIQRWLDLAIVGGQLYAACYKNSNETFTRYQIRSSPDLGLSWPVDSVYYDVDNTGKKPVQLAYGNGFIVAYCLGGGVITSADGFSAWHDTGLIGPSTSSIWLMDPGQRIVYDEGQQKFFVIGHGADGDKIVESTDGIAWSSPVTLPIQGAVSLISVPEVEPIGYEPIPDAPGYYVDTATGEIVGPGGTTISECAPTLAEIVEDQCALRGVTTVDVSELEDDDVLGFRIANTSSPQKTIQGAMPGYFFDSSEFDGVQHFVKRGGADSFHIPFADMCPREPDTIQWERTQEAELLRKVTFTYFDPRATYGVTSQTAERRAGTIQAMGESASQLPIVGSGEWAAQAADITLKAAWAEPDECTFCVSLDWAELVTAAVGTIEDERGTIHRVRIQDIKDDGLQRIITARRTDAAAYQSAVGGKPIPLPTFPGSNLRGPTTWGLLNMPAVLDTHDRPGLYWAATGSFSAWAGAILQVQRAGQWQTIAQTVAGGTVGTLAADLPYHGGDIDTVNTLSLRINSELESVTFAQLLTERNPLAIAYPDGTAEVVQFQDAEVDIDGVWHCTTLLRRRLNTAAGLHAAGARVVAINSNLQFVDLRPDDLGQTLTFRVVSSGTNPDTATPFTMTLDRIWSSTEWEVAELQVERDGDDFAVSWIPRHRLGTDVSPLRSANWDGYLVRWQHSDQFFEEVITDASKTYNIPGASDVTFTVAQLNRLTGAGPETTVTIP